MEQEYGYEICPFDNENEFEPYCCDYERYGNLACGLCGSNKLMQETGLDNLVNGIKLGLNNK